MHGYELRKRLNPVLGSFRALSYGSLYPCLKSLLDRGLDRPGERRRAAAPPRPGPSAPASSTSSPPTARSTSSELLGVVRAGRLGGRHFDVRFAFFAPTDAETRLRILEGRRSRLEERLETSARSSARTRERIDDYTLGLQRHGLEQSSARSAGSTS